MKHCSYCGRKITGEATPVTDDAATGAHIPAYWHTVPTECGPRPSGMDDSSRLQHHLDHAGRTR